MLDSNKFARQPLTNLRCSATYPSPFPHTKLEPTATACFSSRVADPLKPSQSAEDYLERIQELIQEKGYARMVDIASSLKVRQASVTSMVQKLGDLGYVNYVKYRGLVLTPKGREVADRIQRRHETLTRFFSLLGLDEATQQLDIEGIEHHLSGETVECLADLATFLEQNPEVLKRFLQKRKR
jgi:Mn-dependent DtxR family transcriptional regulator